MSNKKQLESLQKCRDIKAEIIRYGISEEELKHLIKMLALELEDTVLMKNILEQYKLKEEKLSV
tara:strand:+ start:200 stop:391 length:192 start_codon:yes stop_codon:yes gene_type:complete